MRKLLLLSLLFPLFASAQYPDDIAYLKSIPPGLGQSIHLPERDYNPDFKFDDSYEYRQKIRLFVVSTDSVYRAMFYRYIFTKDSISNYAKAQKNIYLVGFMERHLRDTLPAIDFSTKDLVLYSACAKCLEVCAHQKGENHCHRAACDFRDTWFIREKTTKYIVSDNK